MPTLRVHGPTHPMLVAVSDGGGPPPGAEPINERSGRRRCGHLRRGDHGRHDAGTPGPSSGQAPPSRGSLCQGELMRRPTGEVRGLESSLADGGLSVPRGAPQGGAPCGRQPADGVRFAIGGLILFSSAAAARRRALTSVERDVFRWVNRLPPGATAALALGMQAGSLAAVPETSAAAVLARRRSMGRDLAVCGLAAWLAAKGVKALVRRDRPGALVADVIFHGPRDAGLGFPSGHAAVAAALAAAAGPHLPPPSRRMVRAAAGVVAVGRLHVGAHLPLDVVGGAALGWMVGSANQLMWGSSPRQRPGEHQDAVDPAAGPRPEAVGPEGAGARRQRGRR